MTTPTSRSLQMLRESGYIVAVVEKWNPHVRIRQDLYGIGDLMAMNTTETLLVQATASGVSARMRKVEADPNLRLWLRSPSRRFQVIGWAKRGARGKRKLWTHRVIEAGLDEAGVVVWKE